MVYLPQPTLVSRAPVNPLKLNGLPLGFIPDIGFDGGNVQTMYGINSVISGIGASCTYGFYDQVYQGTRYTGENILAIAQDVVNSGAVFEPVIMPFEGWRGFTREDNSQAIRVCNTLKRLTDVGVEVRFRFAHEVNYYVETGQYDPGDDMGVSSFKEAWSVVSAACKSIAPSIKMWYTPNAADLTVYERYLPDDFNNTVDIIGIDYYPETVELSTATNFLETVKPFHDKYSSEKVKFMIAEAGTHYFGADLTERLKWLQVITSTEVQRELPNLASVTWYNSLRLTDQLANGIGSDFRIVDPDNPNFDNEPFKELFPSRTHSTPIPTLTTVASLSSSGANRSSPGCMAVIGLCLFSILGQIF